MLLRRTANWFRGSLSRFSTGESPCQPVELLRSKFSSLTCWRLGCLAKDLILVIQSSAKASLLSRDLFQVFFSPLLFLVVLSVLTWQICNSVNNYAVSNHRNLIRFVIPLFLNLAK